MVYKFSKEVKMNNKEFMESVKRTWKLSDPNDIALKENKDDLMIKQKILLL